MADKYDPSKLILPESKPAPNPWPQHGQETMTIEGTRVTLCTIQHGPGQDAFAMSAHIMYEHDDVRTVEFLNGTTERMAIDMITLEIKVVAKQRENAERRAAKPAPGTIGAAVHRLLEEATNACAAYGDEFDLEDLQEAISWVEGYLVDGVIVRADRPRKGEPDGG